MSTYTLPDFASNDSGLELVSNVEVFTSPLTGAMQTLDRGGERWRLRLQYRNLEQGERNRLMGGLAKLNGRQHRVVLRDPSYSGPTGAISAVEMVNVPFEDWFAHTTYPDRGVTEPLSDGLRFRAKYSANGVVIQAPGSADGISAPTVGNSYAAKLTCSDARLGIAAAPNPTTARLRWLSDNWGAELANSAETSLAGRLITAAVCHDATEFFLRPMGKYTTTAFAAESTQDLSQLTASRCLLVDNGVNQVLRSEGFDDAAWTKGFATITANQALAPDGATSGDELVEDSTASQAHYIYQAHTRASAAEYWTGTVFVKKNTNQRLRINVDDGNTGNVGRATFDADTGAITNAAEALGTATYAVASIHPWANGWYRCRLTVKLAASTTARIWVYMCDGASNTITYNGDGSSSVYLWRAQLQQGTQPGRAVQTTGTADSGSGQTGKEIWLKGLDHGVAGQLLAGDQIEINGQLLVLDQDLSADADGVAMAIVTPRIRTATADEDPVILYQPQGFFMLDAETAGWLNRVGPRGPFSDFALNFIEAIT